MPYCRCRAGTPDWHTPPCVTPVNGRPIARNRASMKKQHITRSRQEPQLKHRTHVLDPKRPVHPVWRVPSNQSHGARHSPASRLQDCSPSNSLSPDVGLWRTEKCSRPSKSWQYADLAAIAVQISDLQRQSFAQHSPLAGSRLQIALPCGKMLSYQS